MKKAMIWLFIIMGAALCPGQDGNGGSREQVACIKGWYYSQNEDPKTIDKQPSWDPQKGTCPLEPGKAVQLAVQKMKSTFPSITHLKLRSIELTADLKIAGKWRYCVRFSEKDSPAEDGDFAEVTVCLDGSIPDFKKDVTIVPAKGNAKNEE